jgi:hypothetical protein
MNIWVSLIAKENKYLVLALIVVLLVLVLVQKDKKVTNIFTFYCL